MARLTFHERLHRPTLRPASSSSPDVQILANESEGLTCDMCKATHRQMQTVRLRLTSTNNEYGIPLAPVSHIRPDAKCPMCRFFYRMRWKSSRTSTYHVHAFSALRVVYGKTLAEYNRAQMLSDTDRASFDVPCYAVVPGGKRLSIAHALELSPGDSLFMATQLMEKFNTPTLLGHEISPGSVDYSLIREWMAQCSDESSCGPKTGKMGTIVPLHFIDCQTRDIICWKSKNRAKYVALSYVWGDVKRILSEQDHLKRLPAQCPAVIEDAVIVTTHLGIRYLWVDVFCVSWDAAIRHRQIARMDLVYKHSEVTIIAATGRGAEQGLPGVQGLCRRKQPRVQIGDEIFVSTLPSVESVMKKTSYDTRGWTYQEQFFSYRQLIFTQHQVYFRCPKQTMCESIRLLCDNQTHDRSVRDGVKQELNDKYLRLSQLPEFDIVYRPDGSFEHAKTAHWTKPPTLAIFEHHIHEYSRRKLTYESDSLIAVQSILDRFLHEYHSIEHMCGIPFIPNFNLFYIHQPDNHNEQYGYAWDFLYGLAWTHGSTEKPIKRRKAFPSWSWAGWEGHVRWMIDDTRYDVLKQDAEEDRQPYYIGSSPKGLSESDKDDESDSVAGDSERFSEGLKSRAIQCHHWRTHNGYQFPSTIYIARRWSYYCAVKSKRPGQNSHAFYLQPGFMTAIADELAQNISKKNMVHLTLPEETAGNIAHIHCLGTELARNTSRGIVYILLIYRPNDLTIKKIEKSPAEPFERLGVAIAYTKWHRRQQRHYHIVQLK